MKTIKKLIILLVFALTCGMANTQGKKPEDVIDTPYSTTAVVRDKIDKSLSGDKLVFGTVVQLKKQIGVDNVRLIQRKGAYNCARGEFVLKEVTVMDKDGKVIKDAGIKIDTILIPDLDIVKREFNFMCSDEPIAQAAPIPLPQPLSKIQLIEPDKKYKLPAIK